MPRLPGCLKEVFAEWHLQAGGECILQSGSVQLRRSSYAYGGRGQLRTEGAGRKGHIQEWHNELRHERPERRGNGKLYHYQTP